MQQPRSFHRSHCDLLLVPFALAALLLVPACVPGAATTLSGVGCRDPSCNEVDPDTRKRLGCIGEACSEPSSPGAAKQQAATEKSSSSSQPAAQTGTDSPAHSAGEADADEPSEWKIKVYLESHERP